ncbi:MAG: hypothetical protein HRU00_12565 [Myxococcales bacterium]|nr:hypothetical protein [Myxococcales bacterium]
MPSRSAIVVGSLSRDYADEGVLKGSRPGGVVCYSGRALARMGLRTRVITRLQREDMPSLLAPLQADGVEVLALDSCSTTSYLNDYGRVNDCGKSPDRHKLLSTSEPLRGDDVPPDWREADLIHLGPLHRRDLRPELGTVFGGLTGLDLQGLVRVAGSEYARAEPNPSLEAFLQGVDVVQASEQELSAVLDGDSLDAFIRRHEIAEMIVTRGALGASILSGGCCTEISPPTVLDGPAVGAGDVFLGTYLMLRVEGRDPASAARGATRTSMAQIERGEVPRGFVPDGDE